VGNGWYRCTVSLAASASVAGNLQIAITNATTSYTGNGYSGVYIWGAQLEAGAFATSYIPTVASQVTRSADSASMTGANFSSWYNAQQGTIYMEADGRQPQVIFSNANSGYTNYRNIFRQALVGGQPVQVSEINAGVTYVSSLGLGSTSGTSFKAVYAYATDSFAGSLNGATAVTDTSGFPAFAVDRMGIGLDYGNNSVISTGVYKKIAYYPARVTNAQLQGVTTV